MLEVSTQVKSSPEPSRPDVPLREQINELLTLIAKVSAMAGLDCAYCQKMEDLSGCYGQATELLQRHAVLQAEVQRLRDVVAGTSDDLWVIEG
jgi:hypothetical protein